MKWLRWQGFLPFVIIAVLIYIVTVFFMDHVLKAQISKNLTRLNGALVEVKSVNLSFLQSRFHVQGMQFTDPQDLMRNRLEVGDINLDFRFLPLLKKKFVAEDVSVREVTWGTAREREGGIPKAWQKQWQREEDRDNKPEWLQNLSQHLETQVAASLPSIPFDKLENFNPRDLVDVDELQSVQKVKALPDEMSSQLSAAMTEQKSKLMEQKKALANLESKVDSLKPKQINSPKEVLDAIDTAQSLKSEINKQKQWVEEQKGFTQGVLEEQKQKIKAIYDLADQDIKAIQDKLGIGNLDFNNLSKTLLGNPLYQKYKLYLGYYLQLRQYLPASGEDSNEPELRQRALGRDIIFPITDSTPSVLFEAISASVDSERADSVDDGKKGKFELVAENITTDQRYLGKPTSISLTASLKNSKLNEASVDVILDRLEGRVSDEIKLTAQGLDIRNKKIGSDQVLIVPVKSGEADLGVKVNFGRDTVDASIEASARALQYNFDKPKDPIREIIQDALQEIKGIQVNISLRGAIDKPKLKIASNLDGSLKKALKNSVAGKLTEAEDKVRDLVNQEVKSRVAEAKKKIEGEITALSSALDSRLTEVNSLEKSVQDKINSLKKKQKSLVDDKVNKATDKKKKQATDALKKKLPF